MNKIFIIVKDFLIALASISGFSYKAINIIVYYYKISFILVLSILTILINDFEKLSERLFNKSAMFLNSFSVIGWNYTVASVIICVVIPVFVLSFLIYFAFRLIIINI